MTKSDFQLRFWGVRGSIACPGPSTVRYGGNTSCVEVMCGDHRLILDAGTGLRSLGGKLAALGPLKTDLLLTHTHFDHVCGIPFFPPFYIPGNEIRLWAGHLEEPQNLEQVIIELMIAPLFPVPPGVFVIWDGMGLVAKRVEHSPNSDPPVIIIKSVNPDYETYERDAEEVNVIGRVIWAAKRF